MGSHNRCLGYWLLESFPSSGTFSDHCYRCVSVLRKNVKIQRNKSVSEGDTGVGHV